MIWVALALLSALAMLPLVMSIMKDSRSPSRRDAAFALYQGQLLELGKEVADGRISGQAHAAAVVEIQRRVLVAAYEPETASAARTRKPLLVACAVAPVAALTLYLANGSPNLPSIPRNSIVAEPIARPEDETLAALRGRVARLDPDSSEAQSTYIRIGRAEANRGDMAAAATAWLAALRIRFDPTLAAVTAEALTEVGGQVTGQAANLFRRALAAAPADSPWRPMAEKRLDETKPGSALGRSAHATAN